MPSLPENQSDFHSYRPAAGPRRVGLIGTAETVPVSFLSASLAKKWATSGKQVLVMNGEEGDIDLGDFLLRRPLPPLGDGDLDLTTLTPSPGIRLVPYCLTPDKLRCINHPRFERLRKEEAGSDVLLITLPADAALFSWAPILRSLHAVILQTPVRDADRPGCYQILRFLYQHNPFLRVHLVGIPLEEGTRATVSEGVQFYERLSQLVSRFLQQEVTGTNLLILESELIHAVLDRVLPDSNPSSFTLLMDQLTREILPEEGSAEKIRFPGLFASLESSVVSLRDPLWEGSELFKELEDYFPLDSGVGPKKVTLLLNWERRLAVGEIAKNRIGDALVRGIEGLDWASNHLALLGRLYRKKVNSNLSPHLLLISSDYSPGFIDALTRLSVPVILHRANVSDRGVFVERLSPLPKVPFSPELSPEEREALNADHVRQEM